jgi:formylglycine-generating enzyme required for sulfatase activity
VTRWSPGEAEDLLTKYSWCGNNAASRLHPAGTLRPNDLGLFDMHGNAWEWAQDGPGDDSPGGPVRPGAAVTDTVHRAALGGAFGHGPLAIHSANAITVPPTQRGGDIGFRPARTVP